jgi:TolB-like protein
LLNLIRVLSRQAVTRRIECAQADEGSIDFRNAAAQPSRSAAMGQIFLSYAREDRDFASRIARVLEQAGHAVWWDRRLDGGEEFSAEIEAALDAADVVVVAWSKDSVKSRWVRDEAAVGGDSGSLVPVSIDGSTPPMGFRQFHTLDLGGWKGAKRGHRTAELLHSVERRLNGKAEAAPAPAVPTRRSARSRSKPLWICAAVLILILVSGAALFVVKRVWTEPQQTTPSLAVLPFTADASDADARKLASAAHDAVAHTLSQGSFSVADIEAVSQAGQPSADFVVSGHVTTTPDKLLATIRMQETAHDYVVFSHQFEAARDKLADFAELIGAQVAAQVSWTEPLIEIERRHPSDPAVTRALLGESSTGLQGGGNLADYQNARRLAMIAPNSPLAQSDFAYATAFALDALPAQQRGEAVASARQASDRALALAPESGEMLAPWCLLHSEQRRIECEDRLRKGMRVDPDAPFSNWFLAQLILNPVGRNEEAAELSSLSLAHDPYMPNKIALMLRMLELTGQTSDAEQLYQQSGRWWPDDSEIGWNRLVGMIQRGDFKAAQRFDDEIPGEHPVRPLLTAINGGSLGALRSACAKAQGFQSIVCMLGLARLGDNDTAFALADKLFPSRRGRTPAEEDRIWLNDPDPNSTGFLAGPSAAPMRRGPRFLPLAERTGLLAYWRSGRPPDFCTKQHEPVCAELLKRR